jgi:tetratricopeptide (TPR) repeat protein
MESDGALKQKFAAAVRCYADGQLAETEALCREILRQTPHFPGALVLLAVVLCLADQHDKRLQAIALLQHALAIEPNDPQTLDILGDALTAESDLDAAIDIYCRAIRLAPHNAKLHSKLGVALNGSARHDAAIAAYREAIILDPQVAQTYFNLGVALTDAGRREDAIEVYQQAIARRPNDAAAYVNIGGLYRESGQIERAIEAFRAAVRADRRHVIARFQLAACLHDAGEHGPARDIMREVIAEQHDLPEAHLVLGNILLALGRPAEAKEAFAAEIALDPKCVQAHNNLGAALHDLGRLDEAAAMHRHTLALDPGHVQAHINLGVALEKQGDLAGARAAYVQALALQPSNTLSHATALSNLGIVLEQEGQHEAALAMHERAAAVAPNSAKVRFNLAVNLLRTNDLAAGWDEYEWRWKGGVPTLKMPDIPRPMWNGTPLNGRTLLVHAEQGLGDTLQFARYLDPLMRMGGHVMLVAPGALTRVLRSIKGVTLRDSGENLPPFDVHIPLMSVARVLATRLDTIPAKVPYVAVDPTAVAAWRRRIGDDGALKVGLVWSGNPDHKYDHQRSIPAATILPALMMPGVKLFALQKDVRPADQATLASLGEGITDLGTEFGDFSDTAAAVCALDLVISVDTSVVHLAGALARPTWTLLPFMPDWRWLLGRQDSPWYPTMRLFRQSQRNNWDDVLEQVRTALHCRAVQHAVLPEASHLAICPTNQAAIDIVEATRAGRGRG